MSVTAPRMAAAERRQHLIETAIGLFTDGSYHGTTTAEIARAAGVSEPILYRHFASKRDLYLAALEHVWAKTREGWERKLEGAPDACAAIEAIGKGHVSVRSPKLQLAELWVQALSEASEDSEAWIMLAGGILGMVGRRVGLLDDQELSGIRAARLAWLRG
jgi:AcrR family transcriptional regulator